MTEPTSSLHGISEVARAAGTTSRALRHYQDVGLLEPTQIGANGYRYYDDAALTRLQRILLLRQLGLSVPNIAEALERAEDTTALRAHLTWLRAEAERIDRQIASVERTITALEEGTQIMTEDRFDGFDHTRYKEEVEQRWGKEAWAIGDRWWRALTDDDKEAFKQEHVDIAADWARLREAGAPVDGPDAMGVAQRHHAWIAKGWQGRVPTPDELVGLADMYVADERFAANYGGVDGATYVRDGLTAYALTQLG
jgi:DNA-binding transcriptional MerR regulator